MNKNSEKSSFEQSIKLPLIFVAVLWIIEIADFILPIDLDKIFGLLPRSINGLIGVLTYPLMHGDFAHVFSNSMPLVVLGFILLQSYRKVAWKTLAFIYLASGVALWFLARGNFHIGASGIVYGLAFFIFFSGIFRKDIKSIALALVVAFLYGGIVWGVLPIQEGVSWEGHLFGGIAGALAAYRFRNVNKEAEHEWNEKPDPNNIIEDPFWVRKKKKQSLPESQPLPAPPVSNTSVEDELEALKVKYDYVKKKKEGE